MSGTDSKLPSQQQNLDTASTQSPEAVLPPKHKHNSNRGPNRRPRYVTDPFLELREGIELRHKYGLD